MRKFGVAILGIGIIAKNGHIPGILNSSEHLKLAAIYCRKTTRAQSFLSELKLSDVEVYSEEANDFEKLLARDDIDIYVVALPIKLQPPFIRRILQAGKHVLSEKPIAENCKDARELLDFYDKLERKPLWGVAENFRFKRAVDVARRELPKYGPVATFHVFDQNYTGFDNPYFNTAWRQAPEHQGGFIMDGGLHCIAALRYLLGEKTITRVAAFANQVAPHLPPMDTLNATVVLSDGTNGTYSGAYSAGIHLKDCVIICEKANLQVGVNKVTIRDAKHNVLFEECWDPSKPENHAVTQELKSFAESVEQGVLDPRLDAREAYQDLHVLEQMIQSAREQGTPKPVNAAPSLSK